MKHSLLAVAAAFALALSASTASAGFLASPQSFHKFGPPNTADGNVNFAIYDTLGDSFAADYGATLVVQDGGVPTGRYIYLYQVVNQDVGGGDDTLESLQVEVTNASLIDSLGYVTIGASGAVFNESPGGHIDNSNPKLNNGLAAGAEVEADAGAILPISGNIDGVSDPNRIEWTFAIPTTGYGTLFYFTSDELFHFTEAFLSTDDTTNTGSLPTPTPVPSGIALLLSAIPGLAGLGLVRRIRSRKVSG